jgi:hypothetical protein
VTVGSQLFRVYVVALHGVREYRLHPGYHSKYEDYTASAKGGGLLPWLLLEMVTGLHVGQSGQWEVDSIYKHLQLMHCPLRNGLRKTDKWRHYLCLLK